MVLTTLIFLVDANASIPSNRNTNQPQNYWRLNFPSNTPLPIYVYKGQTPIAFIEKLSQPVFLGKYNDSSSNGTYQIIATTSGNQPYTGCTITINVTDTTKGTCKSIVSNQLTGNEQIITYGSGLQPYTGPIIPSKPTYPPRVIIFKNNTNTTRTLIITQKGGVSKSKYDIGPNSSYTYNISDSGITSYNFTIDDTNSASFIGNDFRTLLEATYPALSSTNQANVDVSMVNGFNIKYKFYPQIGSYFAHDFQKAKKGSISPEQVDFYDSNNPASAFAPQNGLEPFCQQIDTEMNNSNPIFPKGSFLVKNNNIFIGCNSPRAETSGTPNADMYGCAGNYNTPETCTTASTTPYVNDVHNDANTVHGYAYPYDDWFADFGIDRHTNLVFEINS